MIDGNKDKIYEIKKDAKTLAQAMGFNNDWNDMRDNAVEDIMSFISMKAFNELRKVLLSDENVKVITFSATHAEIIEMILKQGFGSVEGVAAGFYIGNTYISFLAYMRSVIKSILDNPNSHKIFTSLSNEEIASVSRFIAYCIIYEERTPNIHDIVSYIQSSF